jgi:hypothetical protein
MLVGFRFLLDDKRFYKLLQLEVWCFFEKKYGPRVVLKKMGKLESLTH